MDEREIEREVRRLAPWYYLFELGGVRTDITEPFDHWGHRRPQAPAPRNDFWSGKSVLDLGCNEGGLAFSALSHGAARCHGVEYRGANVEKARFVARVQGHDNATFEVGEVDDWLAAHPETSHDIVLACGLLYHLPYPWDTLNRICAIASEAVVVTSVLAGGSEGYTPFEEWESIGASASPEELSQMPNSALTIAEALAKNGFVPVFMSETRVDDAAVWGGCLVIGERPERPLRERVRETREGARLALYTTARTSGGESTVLEVLLYDLAGRERQIRLELRLPGEGVPPGTERVREVPLSARPRDTIGEKQDSRSTSFEIQPHTTVPLRLLAFEGDDSKPLVECLLEIG
jgi:SAM-dependent methyltransferase